ncbi:MAG: phenylacetate-CoA oxygenase subunit PaaI [Limnohabitans sp.]|nr:phenylacetate-CoA oxygenase subunit PaaI [Limnohabitans sp.]
MSAAQSTISSGVRTSAHLAPQVGSTTLPIDYLLHLADNALVLGQRNAEWSGHGPILEEDIALSNNSLDLIGQARLLYQEASAQLGNGATEDTLAFFRDVPDFKNYTLLELPHHPPLASTSASERDFATTLVRNFLYSALMVLVWDKLQHAPHAQLAAIAAKSLKEVRYHLRHSRDWLLRMGDGTAESHGRAQTAVNHLMPYTQEFWTSTEYESEASKATGLDMASLQNDWNQIVGQALTEATLKRPAPGGFVPTGKHSVHSEHLGFMLAEMQSLPRAHPNATW